MAKKRDSKNFFTLFAHGPGFDIDAYLATTTLDFDRIWRRGDPLGCGGSTRATSGVEKILGDGPNLSYDEQEEIACDYLYKHLDELHALAEYPGADTFILGFHYVLEVYSNSVAYCVGPSRELTLFAASARVSLTYYLVVERRRGPR